jgi:hypothetical protein
MLAQVGCNAGGGISAREDAEEDAVVTCAMVVRVDMQACTHGLQEPKPSW